MSEITFYEIQEASKTRLMFKLKTGRVFARDTRVDHEILEGEVTPSMLKEYSVQYNAYLAEKTPAVVEESLLTSEEVKAIQEFLSSEEAEVKAIQEFLSSEEAEVKEIQEFLSSEDEIKPVIKEDLGEEDNG